MAEVILNDIKKLLGIDPSYDAFDTDIRIYINTAFSVLSQIGSAPPEGYMIISGNETWEDFLEDRKTIEMVKSYIYLKVRLVFDPPTTSFALAAIQEQIKELEFRLNIQEELYNPDAYSVDALALVVDNDN